MSISTRVLAIGLRVCVRVRLSVRLSATSGYRVETSARIKLVFGMQASTHPTVF